MSGVQIIDLGKDRVSIPQKSEEFHVRNSLVHFCKKEKRLGVTLSDMIIVDSLI